MTAKRMGAGPSHPQAQPNHHSQPNHQSMNSTFPSSSSQHNRLLDPSESQHSSQQHHEIHPTNHSAGNSSTNPLAHTTPIKLPSQHTAVSVSNGTHLNTVATPVDKGLSVQELKALTRMRLAREAGSSHGPESHPVSMNNSANPSTSDGFRRPVSPPIEGFEYVPTKKSVEDYMGAVLHDVHSHKKPLTHHSHPTGHAPRSSSTSPTVESSSTGSDSDYVMQSYNAKKYTSSRQYPPGIGTSTYSSLPNSGDSYEIDRVAHRRSRSNSISSVEKNHYLDPFAVTTSSDYEPPHPLDRDRGGRERYHPDQHPNGNGSRHVEQSYQDHNYIENSTIERKLQEYYRHDRQPQRQSQVSLDQEYNTHQNRTRSRHDYLPHRHDDHSRDPREHNDRPYHPHEHNRYQTGQHELHETSSAGVPSAVLHAKLLNLEQQQLERELRERELRERDIREQQQMKYRHQREQQVREQQLREQHMRDQRRREQLLHAQQEREKQHREQQQREHQHREQQLREQHMRDQQLRDMQKREQLLREREREQQQREHLHREQLGVEREYREKTVVQTSHDEEVHPLTLEIPDSEDDSESGPVRQELEQQQQQSQPQQQLPIASTKPPVAPLYEGSLRKMVMTKSVANNTGNVSGYDVPVSTASDNLDTSLLPSGSPFRPAVETVPDHSLVLPELQPSPPDSPRSMRHGSRRQLSVNCPAPVRMRSSSDINDLAFSVAESVLLTPTAMSPASSMHKALASSPSSVSSSQRDSMDSPRGSFSAPSITSVSNSVSNSNAGSGSVASGGGGSGLDVDLLMNQFSLDSNDEYTHSTVEMANSITEF